MSVPAAWIAAADQLGAASRDAQEMLAECVALLGKRHTIDCTTPGPFAGKLLYDVDDRIKKHRQRLCSHLKGRFGVTWLLGWAPERMYCQRCAFKVLVQAFGTPEDYTCDVCRRESANGVSPVMGAFGHVIMLFGACDDCYAREIGATA